MVHNNTENNMLARPLVSIIVCFLNGEKFLREAVDSVLAQTYPAWELILVDDGSSDSSTSIAHAYADKHPQKIRYLEHAGHQNKGASASRNFGVSNATGQFVAFLDVDDIWLPQKLEQQMKIIESHPRVAMVYGASQYWHTWAGTADESERDYVPDHGIAPDRIYEPPILSTLLYPLGTGTAPCPSSLLIRRDTILKIGGFEEQFRAERQLYEDQAFLMKIYLESPVFVSSEWWDRYRIRRDSCVPMVTNGGQYHAVRLFFLDWLERYLLAKGITDTRVWAAFCRSVSAYRQPAVPNSLRTALRNVDQRESRWSLRLGGGNIATLSFPSDDNDLLRLDIQRLQTTTSYDIQLNHPRLRIEKDHSYRLSFHASADKSRSISFGVARSEKPWTDLGLYRTVQVTPLWQSFETEFIAACSDSNARILFDVGGSDIAFAMKNVSLNDLTDGRVIEPDDTWIRMLNSPGDLDESVQSTTRLSREAALIPSSDKTFGLLRRLTPISRDWGWDRGLPVDRYYIEQFLMRHAHDVRGRVLEIGDNYYTVKFGADRVVQSDILDVDVRNPNATILGDLAGAEMIADESFDCIILTQTLNRIYEVRNAISAIYRILRPGGVALATFPGITQMDRKEATPWFWSFTTDSAKRLFEEVFASRAVHIESHGNLLAAITFLYGLAMQELTHEELNYHDPDYEVLITVRAVKSEE